MKFTHRTYERGQTIAAIATPPGEGGIAVIRISGEEALAVSDKIFSGPIFSFKTHTVHFGKILNETGVFIDEGLAVVMRAPHSYTGEDTVEIHCHGGILITRQVLKAALGSGARVALPGEFTCRAFQNGKIDLTKAEAVQQLIHAKSVLAMQAAENQLQGKLHQIIVSFQSKLTDIAATLEAWVDFPEEGLVLASHEHMCDEMMHIKKRMLFLLETFDEGKKLQTQPSICLLGAPNVGKSSLMNTLLGEERAIVTHVPGTTRDTLEETLLLGHLNCLLIDTAGLRKADNLIEREGIKRSFVAAKNADLLLFLVDVSHPVFDSELIDTFPQDRTLVVWNKTDLSPAPFLPSFPFPSVEISAKTGKGIEQLKKGISRIMWGKGVPSKEQVILTSERHFESLRRATETVEKVIQGLKCQLSPEFLTSDIRSALQELGTIIGLDVTEDILGAIFAKFCVGK